MNPTKPIFFRSPAEFRAWLEAHHAEADALLVGYQKRGTGKPSMTWPESVDQALCYGWIDGVRKTIDESRYQIRFSRRRPGSNWSNVNTRRARALIREGLMRPAGLRAFQARKEYRSGIYSYEQRPPELIEPYAGMLRRNRAAWRSFQARPPWYRKAVTWWILSAKKEETKLRRIETLIALEATGQPLPGLTRKKAV